MSRSPLKGERLIRSKSYLRFRSDGPRDLAAAQAAGARINVLRGTVDDGLDALDVGLPHTVGTTMRVAHLDTEGNALVTELTLRHAYCTSLWISLPIGQPTYNSRIFQGLQGFFSGFRSFLFGVKIVK